MAYNNYKGWYKLLNPEKFIKPVDKHMQSFNESTYEVQYKSRLELHAIKYCDFNKNIIKFSLEPFPIPYVKPTDGKVHRYYIDLFIEFKTGDKFLVEIKSKGETLPPKKPKNLTAKSKARHNKAASTYQVNLAKWDAAREFASKNNMRFIILTEDELN